MREAAADVSKKLRQEDGLQHASSVSSTSFTRRRSPRARGQPHSPSGSRTAPRTAAAVVLVSGCALYGARRARVGHKDRLTELGGDGEKMNIQ